MNPRPTDEPRITVAIPTHNPRGHYLAAVIAALQRQSLRPERWELVLVDNASTVPVPESTVTWHPRGRVIKEPKLGLTQARLTALKQSTAAIVVWVDDDNVLGPGYLEQVENIFSARTKIGAAGGKTLPVYEVPPPPWFHLGLAPIGCRDLGDTEILCSWDDTSARQYPAAAPIGAGLAIRREAMNAWADAVQNDAVRRTLGRTGAALTSGEDNDLNLTLLRAGWQLLYSPHLTLNHLIPAQRLTIGYQRRLAFASYRDFVTVLRLHGVCPWRPVPRWLLGILKLRAWFRGRAWSSPEASIRWAGNCGQFEGRAVRLG